MVSLEMLQLINKERAEEWPGNENITLEFRGLELAGEAGELCNVIKKLARVRLEIVGTTEGEGRLSEMVSDEIGDVVICATLIANHLNLSLEECVVNKFNKTSLKHDLKARL